MRRDGQQGIARCRRVLELLVGPSDRRMAGSSCRTVADALVAIGLRLAEIAIDE
jgi:hypothetical protein